MLIGAILDEIISVSKIKRGLIRTDINFKPLSFFESLFSYSEIRIEYINVWSETFKNETTYYIEIAKHELSKVDTLKKYTDKYQNIKVLLSTKDYFIADV